MSVWDASPAFTDFGNTFKEKESFELGMQTPQTSLEIEIISLIFLIKEAQFIGKLEENLNILLLMVVKPTACA